jgi:polysaccharide biosynthesis transport protein
MDLSYFFKAMMRRKWIILACVALALISAFFFTRNLKKEYKSVAQLSTGFTESEAIDPTRGVNYLQSELRFNNAIENITSPKVLTLVSYNILLHDLQSEQPFSRMTDARLDSNKLNRKDLIAQTSAWLDSMKLLSSAQPEEKKVLGFMGLLGYNIESISKGLTVNRFQKSDYINIEYKSSNPYLSAFVVNTLCREFKRFYGLNERTRSTLSISSLDSIVKQKKAILDQKNKAKQEFISASGMLDANMEGQTKLSQISGMENQLIAEKGVFQNQSYRVQQLEGLIQRMKGTSTPATSGTVTPSENVNANLEYIQLRKQYNNLYSQYISTGATDSAMKRRLDDLSQQMVLKKLQQDRSGGGGYTSPNDAASLDQLVQKSIDAKAELEASRTKIAAIETKLGQLKGGISGMAATSAAAKQYDNEIQLASAEYTEANEQLNLASNYSETRPDSFRQTLLGQPALQPEPSKRLLIIILAGMFAFVLSSVVIIFKEFLDQSIKTPSYFLRLTDLPLLGAVNKIKFNKQNLLERITTFNEEEKHRDNTFLELLRKLRYEIESSGKKIFLFTSTEPQQGKTALIQALSYILSLGKKKTLIIDTNFCNNDLTAAIDAAPVLENFEVNGKPFEVKDLMTFVSPTIVDGISIIGCKGGDYTPSEILPRNHLLKYLNQITEEYDFIFMEGAPLNGFTDTKELLPYAEGMIAIFSAEKTFSAADKESIKFLKENRNKFLGAILNKVHEDNLGS